MTCGTVHSATFAVDLMASTDCLIRAQVEQGYAGLLAPGGVLSVALTLALTIYVALTGYRLILGRVGFSLHDLVPHFLKLAVILALVTSWPSYQTLVVDLLFKGPTQLADLIVARAAGTSGAPGDVLAALQLVFDRLTDAAADAWSQVAVAAPAAPPAAPASAAPVATGLGAPQFAAALLWFAAGTMMAMTIGLLLVARILLALLLLLGPVFVAAALFPATRGLFEGWLRITARFALVPLFTLPLTAVMLAALAPFAARVGEAPVDSIRDGPVLAVVAIVFVFAAVMHQVLRVAATIAAGLRWPGETMVPTAPASAPSPVSSRNLPIASPSRAELIVQSIATSDRRSREIVGARTPAAAGRVGASTGESPSPGPPRLGQSYRRLAVTGAGR